jgi:hypothetical protein
MRVSLGDALLSAPDPAAAEAEIRAALPDLVAGAPTSRAHALARMVLCEALVGQDRIEEARRECTASVTTMEAALGRDNAGLVSPLTERGKLELRAKKPADAIPFLRRASALAASGNVRPNEALYADAFLAIALARSKQAREARPLAKHILPKLTGPELAGAREELIATFPDLADFAPR